MIRSSAFLALALFAFSPSFAADAPPAPQPAVPQPTEMSEAGHIDDLFARLAKTQDEDESAGIVKAIEREWMKSGSDVSDLLMSRALEAFESQDFTLALEFLDTIVATEPDWPEGWNKRATVRFYAGDADGSAADVAQVLKRNPRHIGALVGLGLILEHNDRKQDSLKVLQRAEALAPHYKPVEEAVARLKAAVAGQSL